MFFEKENISFNLLDVLKINQTNNNIYNLNRNFNALSFRTRADTELITDNKNYHLKDNSVTYVPARLNYRRTATKDELIVIHFDSTDYRTEEIETFDPDNYEKLKQLFEDILICWNKKELGYKYKCSSIFYEILAECYVQNFKLKNQDSKIQKSIDYLLKNFKDPDLTIEKIAKKSFVSEVYFRKLFKKEYGVSPQKYIVNLRIQNAMGLISAGYYSLKEIAYMSGYNDYKYFSVEFKKLIGISPSEYVYNY